MGDVLFYQLSRSGLDQTVAELCQKCLARGWRVLVHSSNRQRLEQLDQALWTARDDDFLPHGLAGTEHDPRQPVLLNDLLENGNSAQVLMVVDGASITADLAARFDRVCLIFDGANTHQVDRARLDWKTVTGAGLTAQYWSQESGRWQMKAESAG